MDYLVHLKATNSRSSSLPLNVILGLLLCGASFQGRWFLYVARNAALQNFQF